jgi:hypothetical protein
MDKSDGTPIIEYKDMDVDDLLSEYIDAQENLRGWMTMPSGLGPDTKHQQIEAGEAELKAIKDALCTAAVKGVSVGILTCGQRMTERGIEVIMKTTPETIPGGEYDLVPHRE